MALNWEEARVIVTCRDLRELGEVASDAIVVTLTPDEARTPESAEAVRNLVLDRTIERRRQTLNEVYELGTSLPEPTFEGEDRDDDATAAERDLLRSLLELEAERGEGDDEGDWAGSTLDPVEHGLMLGGAAGSGVRIFIGRVEELVVNN